MTVLRRIPFDSIALAAICSELQQFVLGKVQGIRQPDANTIVLELYRQGRVGQFFISCDPEGARAHFVTKRPGTAPVPPTFCSTLRARINEAGIVGVRMMASDRVLEIGLSGSQGDYRLIAEIMGKHSNIILVDSDQRCVAAAKWIGAGKSSRPILSGGLYVRPPVLRNAPDLEKFDSPVEVMKTATSPFATSLLTASQVPSKWGAVISYTHGAYPLPVAALGYETLSRESFSIALEQYVDVAVPARELESKRSTLISQLERVSLARSTALQDLYSARDAGDKAPHWQRLGELILAYGFSQPPGQSKLQAWDYEGNEVTIKVDPDLDVNKNAQVYFEKAKKAKGRIGHVLDQIGRIEADLAVVMGMIERARACERLDQLEQLREKAAAARYTHSTVVVAAKKEDRPYEGHKIREFLAPGGFTVLVGETAEANDYLTMRVAKGNDWWLHVRGGTSAHAVIRTAGRPERVQPETFEFAAKLCARHSPQKHAAIVAVDYTLKKYVTKQRGAAKGSVTYNREKTLHVASDLN